MLLKSYNLQAQKLLTEQSYEVETALHEPSWQNESK